MDSRIAQLKTPESCEQFARDVQEQHPTLAVEARRRAVELRVASHGAISDVEREVYEAVYAYEQALSAKRGKKARANGSWNMIKKYGVIPAVERIVRRRDVSSGYRELAKMGMEDMLFESVVLRHPEVFSAEAITHSTERLHGHSTQASNSKEPGRAIARLHEAPALVLVENEVTIGGKFDFWADDTGVQYQFPNSYKNRVKPGKPFVYYRGVRRAGGTRGSAEYFGTGVIGDVWVDPNQPKDIPARNRRWFCSIEDYLPFNSPVPAKQDGIPYEMIESTLGWRTGVREITSAILEKILAEAGRHAPDTLTSTVSVESVHPLIEHDLGRLLLRRPKSDSAARKGSPGGRRSKYAKETGDWAESLVHRYLLETLPAAVRESVDWLANRGETPGWDISYTDADGKSIAVEVKATVQSKFAAVDMTAREWRSASERGATYVVALVTGAMGRNARIGFLWDPAALCATGKTSIEPTMFRLDLRMNSESL